MSTTISALVAANAIDGTNDYFPIDIASPNATQKINRNVFLGVTGQPADISSAQSVTNKTLNNTNTVTLRDDRFTLQDNLDTTKQAVFQLSGITTATTRTYTMPNASTTLVGTDATQTLTNKTLTSPTITGGSISNSTISVDSISEFTPAAGVTIDGLNIKDAKLNTNNSVVNANITDSAVTPAKLFAGTGTTWVTTDYSSATKTGWSSTTINQIRYKQTGKIVTLFVYITGTSNSTSTSIVLPVLPATTLAFYDGAYGLAQNNGSFISTTPRYSIDSSMTTVIFFPDVAGGSWTASGTKSIRATVIYEAV